MSISLIKDLGDMKKVLCLLFSLLVLFSNLSPVLADTVILTDGTRFENCKVFFYNDGKTVDTIFDSSHKIVWYNDLSQLDNTYWTVYKKNEQDKKYKLKHINKKLQKEQQIKEIEDKFSVNINTLNQNYIRMKKEYESRPQVASVIKSQEINNQDNSASLAGALILGLFGVACLSATAASNAYVVPPVIPQINNAPVSYYNNRGQMQGWSQQDGRGTTFIYDNKGQNIGTYR